MTKQEFLDGNVFELGYGKYKFHKSTYAEEGIGGFLVSIVGNITMGHEANIRTLGEKGISYYTTIMGRTHKGYVYFRDMKLIPKLHKGEVVDGSYPKEFQEAYPNPIEEEKL